LSDDQIAALAKAMSTIPGLDPNKGRTPVNAAVRRLWATELITKWGVSIDPGQATVEAVNAAPELGNVGPHTVADKKAEKAVAAQFLQENAPGFMAANTPDLAARIAAAKTADQRDALTAELRQKILDDPNVIVTDLLGLLPKDGV
jgi:hypothetical protein